MSLNNPTISSTAGGSDKQFWVVLPTYNEASNLPQMLKALRGLGLNLQVVVVDDASPDGTGQLATRAAGEDPHVHVILRKGERGLGTAYLAGFRYALAAGADAVITMDCDFSHDPRSIPDMVAAFGPAEIVIGSRYIPGGRTKNWGLHRKILSAAANRFARILFRMPARDCTSGFRLYERHVLESVIVNAPRSTGYAFLVEVLFLATQHRRVVITEVPICFVDRERGSGKMGAREIAGGIKNLLWLRAEAWRGREQIG